MLILLRPLDACVRKLNGISHLLKMMEMDRAGDDKHAHKEKRKEGRESAILHTDKVDDLA